MLRVLCAAGCLIACGAPPPTPTTLDVFHDVYFRGPPSAPARVALTFSAPDRCTADLLAALRRAGGTNRAVPATFFMSGAAIDDAVERDAEGLRAVLRRVIDEGHEIALAVDVESGWRGDPAAFRRGVQAAEQALAGALRAQRLGPVRVQRFWRPPPRGVTDLAELGRAAAVDRPLVLWSRFAQGAAAAGIVESVGRTAAGDIIAFDPGSDCAIVEAVPGVARQLAAAQVTPTRVSELLGAHLSRHEPLRVVRYVGEGLPRACVEPLATPPDPAGERARWGVVDLATADAVRLLPVPTTSAETAALLADDGALVHRLWGARAQWRGMPGCQRDVPWARVISPITATRGAARIGFWVADVDLHARDARTIAAPSHPTILPGLHDLARMEARQRLPARYRGLVAGALDGLGLEVPFLIEARATVGVVVGRGLAPEALDAGVDTLRDAVAGFVQLVEVSLGEYLFLAEQDPRGRVALSRAARSSDGFVRAGPFLTLPGGRASAPDAARLALDGALALHAPPELLLARVLRSGRALAPGDVVAAPTSPLRGAPPASLPDDADSMRAALRGALTRSILSGLAVPAYLRPGGNMQVDGDLLGRQNLRIAVPAGVAVPTTSTRPIGASEGESEPR